MNFKKLNGYLWAFLFLWQFSAYAYQPTIADYKILGLKKRGNPQDVMGKIVLKNTTKNNLIFKYAPNKKDGTGAFKLSPALVRVRPGQSVPVHFRGALRGKGKKQIFFSFDVLSEKKLKISVFKVDLYFKVSGRDYKLSTYKDLFLKRDLIDGKMGGNFLSQKVTNSMRMGRNYRRKMPTMKRMINLNRDLIFKIPTTSGIGRNIILNTPIFRRMENNVETDHSDFFSNKAINVSASGKFSYKDLNNHLQPAFGWKVRAWRKKNSGWKKVAEDWVQSSGNWSLSFPQSSKKLKFQYVAFNRFFKPLDPNNKTYKWVGPMHNSVSLNHNEGHWFAKTASGNARGLGEIYDEGMVLWSKLYWSGGINPLRGSAIKVYFPNTNYNCGDPSKTAWSCASTSGKIWLIPSHAARFGVMTHELGHQINYEFWNNQRPPNSGGAHSLGSCYTPGLAMMEGFANFLVFWAHSARSADPNSGFDFRVEAPNFACSTLNKNESWVAANFWDLHDTRFDGADNLWFVHQGAVPKIYLTAGKKNSMAHFHSLYRSKANSGHRNIIDDIFAQNNIIP